MNVKIKRLHKEAQMPVYSTYGSTGCDLSSLEEVIIKPGEVGFLKTGLALEVPDGYAVLLAPRSSICFKKHLDMPNSAGVIDSDYRGEIIIALRNLGKEDVIIEKHERIAQAIFINFMRPVFHEVENLTDTERGKGGFGSTGKF